ncbi:MAG: hypothetical protein HW390_85 [Candidatus Brocadiaceae bacterium]|nr:hypothetical protein [Candidatus Brocadiaceae bacterium]
MMDYATLDNDTLVNLLFTEDDRLPRQAVDELVRRGERMIEPLSNIVLEKERWTKDRPEIWAPIHAVYILGAIGTQEVIAPLMAAIKWSDKYNIDCLLYPKLAVFL